ncbi:NADH-quinone oxidoreductase subunit N [Paenibacillus chartarius]|uniref:NADH-quinone oxidoreductase subunit N n=1 Tax=Paenibacillus chartarius TaxID=747481 RepID=A0ABV6DUQ0_9BACL
MEAIRLQLSDLGYLAPELTLVITAIVAALLDLALPRTVSRQFAAWLSLAGVVVAFVFTALALNPAEPIALLGQSYRIDDFGSLLKLVILGGTGLILFMSLGSTEREGIQHVGEYYYFFLPAALGAMIMASSGDLVTLYAGLELLSITSYILVAMRKRSMNASEGAFKYLVLGSISSAVILYGMSFLYGISGSTNLLEINQAIAGSIESAPALIYIAFFLLLAGFGFKIAAAPFHAWAPDVYQGAPTPVAAFLAVVSKGAGFAILFRTMYWVFGAFTLMNSELQKDALLSLSVMAAIAMVVGNTMALRQTNVKRLLALSGIANAGYLLVPIAAHFSLTHYANYSEFLYYLIAYLFMNIGAFALLMIVERSSGTEELKGFAGLYYRAPLTAVAAVLIVLSLAGIPVTAGFFGKLFIILGAMQTQLYWLGAVMIVTSVISFYYYFGWIRQMFMRSDYESDEVKVAWPLGITVWVCALAGVALGAYPQGLLSAVDRIFSLAKDMFVM